MATETEQPPPSPARPQSTAALAAARLKQALRDRHPDLGAHGANVSRLSVATGERLGLGPVELIEVARVAELHDIGKLAIPPAVINKPGPLDEAEWELIRKHTVIGERILLAASPLAPLAPLVRATHERFDGSGYPDGLAGEAIPLAARIVFACDSYDAMVSRRPYANPMSPAVARAQLRDCAGTQFDPRVIAALCAVLGAASARVGGAASATGYAAEAFAAAGSGGNSKLAGRLAASQLGARAA